MKHLIIALLAIFSLSAVAQKKTDYDKALALHEKKAYAKAIKAFDKEAQGGNLPAMYYAALYCEKGMGSDTNYTAAIAWYKRIISQQSQAQAGLFADDLSQLTTAILPPGKTTADMVEQFKQLAQKAPLHTEEIYQYALCRESLLTGDDAAPGSKARQQILSSYTTAANQDYRPAMYRAATMLEATNPKQAAMYYRWACYDLLEQYNIPKLARIQTQSMFQNTMVHSINGEANQERWTVPEIFEPGPGLRHGEMTILNVTDDHVSFETFMEYVDGSRKATNKFVVNRGETLTLLMTGVTDMRCELYVTYKK